MTKEPKNHLEKVADDREDFRANAKQQSIALGQDKPLFEAALKTLLAADQYDYTYLWTWMGVPIIQLPADVMATQEVIFKAKPDVIIETGVARGGSLIFMASLQQLYGGNFVIGVDIDIRPHNRDSIDSHIMASRIKLVEGPSTDRQTLDKVISLIPTGATVMVVLDSDHSRDHVLSELRTYGPLVTPGQYLVVADTLVGYIKQEDASVRRSQLWFQGNEPLSALQSYLTETNHFEVDQALNGKLILSSSPGGYLRCVRGLA